MNPFSKYFLFRRQLIDHIISFGLLLIRIAMLLVSLFTIGTALYLLGFDTDSVTREMANTAFKHYRHSFVVLLTIRWLLSTLSRTQLMRLPAKIMLGLLYLPILLLIFHRPEASNSPFALLWGIFESNLYLFVLLGSIAVVELSDDISGILSRRANPSLLIILSFFFIILMGTGLLLLPKATTTGISVIDAFFIATSAVCVTGLTPLDIAVTFTPLGQTFIILLIQIGGLGVMTFTSFFALFFMGNSKMYNQLAMSDIIQPDSLNSLLSTLWKILLFTLTIELAGAACIYLSMSNTSMTPQEGIFFSLFHSISAFCNAGFSTLSGNLYDPVVRGNNFFLTAISLLIVLGGIGFPILSNLTRVVQIHIKHLFRPNERHVTHLYSFNTKIVLLTTAWLIVGGSVIIGCLEWSRAFAGMSIPEKITQSFFNAVTPRTAGFNSLPVESFSIQSVLVVMLLMWIGGASQSTAGGIKVNAFATAFVSFFAVIRGKQRCEVFGREIPGESVHRAHAAVIGSITLLSITLFVLTLIEPHISPLHLLYEAISALSTVGLSLNTTPLLGTEAKIIIASLMFIGRVGVITFLLGIITQSKHKKYEYPQDSIIIN